MKNINFVIPVYNEGNVIEIAAKKLFEVIDLLISENKISKECKILFVDDGSTDNTWDVIAELNQQNDKIKGLKLIKNYGQQNALYAGLMFVKDDCDAAISLDVDLQDDISLISQFIEKFEEGYEIVLAAHDDRKSDLFLKRFVSECFYGFMKFLNPNTIKNHSEFRLISKDVINRLSQYSETDLFLRLLIPELSDKKYIYHTTRRSRIAGTPKYNIFKSFELAINGMISFSNKPVRFISLCGILLMLLSLFFITDSIKLFSIWFIGGLQIFFTGIIGEYIAKTYFETKKRPKYIVEKTI